LDVYSIDILAIYQVPRLGHYILSVGERHCRGSYQLFEVKNATRRVRTEILAVDNN
jgi:hypothetical protein